MKKIIVLICFLLNFATQTVFANTHEEAWRQYIDGTLGKPIYYLYHDAKNKFFNHPKPYRALDLGSGAGNEVVDLLTAGFDVTGSDLSPRSYEVIKARANGLKGHFEFQQGDFSSVQMKGYYDFVISILALPFGNKKDLPTILNKLSLHTKTGAIFIVTFFNYGHDFVKRGEAYGISQNELFNYLKQSGFKINFFLNRTYDQKDFSGTNTHWDVFDIIAIRD